MIKRPMTVALTGGIGSGKSTVSALFAALGVPIIDADQIARRIAEPDGAAYPAMVALLGVDAIAADGRIRRDQVRKLVFQDDDLRRRLEHIVHPIVRGEIGKTLGKIDHAYCIVSIPLLLETGSPGDFDRILVVDLPDDLRLGEHQQVVVALQVFRMRREARAAEGGLIQPVALDHGAHGPVEDEDALRQQLLELAQTV